MKVERVLVVGGGTMGPAIASTFAASGFDTTLLSRNPDRVRSQADGPAVTSVMPDEAPHLVIEAIPERIGLKNELFAQLEARYGDAPIIATNTSGLPLQEMAALLSAPQRFIGIHYFQPAHLLPMVEVTLVAETAPEVLNATLAALLRTGRRAAVVGRPITGFLINRLQHAMLHEAFHLIDQGIATAEAIDEAARWVLGPRMSVTGLIEQKDISGLDVAAASQRRIVPALHHGAEPSPVLQDRVANGDFGVKSGQGFYDWRDRDVPAYVRRKEATLARLIEFLQSEKQVMSFSRVAIIGAGTIGGGWAAWLLSRGLEVHVWDPGAGAEERLRRFVDDAWSDLQQLGMSADADRTRMRFVNTIEEACAGVDFIQENAPENEALKIDLLGRLDAAAPEEIVIASSTSSLLMERMQRDCRRAPQRCLLGHPFNPPHLMPLVEVSGSPTTSPEALERAMAFYRFIGKKPVRLRREVQGHIAGRLGAAAWREAVHLVAEGICDVADIDETMTYGPGLRWATVGPHMAFHLGGGQGGMRHYLDHLGPSQERRWADLGQPKLTPEVCEALIKGIEDEAAGLSIEELARRRDRRLLAVIAALRALDE